MSAVTREQIENFFQQHSAPGLNTDLITTKAIKNITITDEKVIIDIVLGYPVASIKDHLIATWQQGLQKIPGIKDATINLTWQIVAHVTQQGVKPVPGVKNIIAVASGKGGVGKSTTAVNIALALAKEGANVGILDADIYGPNQPQMLGIVDTKPQVEQEKYFIPIVQHGIQSMSMGYLADSNTAMIWRGPMVSTALQQLVFDTKWNDVDYLVIDLPPGTGDIQLTLAQKIPVTGAVIITTPQDIALLDARKGLEMFHKVKVPVIGIIENMSTHVCQQCGYQEPIFGHGGGEKMAKECDIELLGQLPLAMSIRLQADSGNPTVVADPAGQIAKTYGEIARKITAKLSLQAKNYAVKFPKVVVESG